MKSYSQYIKQINEGVWDEMPSDEELQRIHPGLSTPNERALKFKEEYERREKEREASGLRREKFGSDLEEERKQILYNLGTMMIKSQKQDPSFLDKLLSLMEEYSHLMEDTSIKSNRFDASGKQVKTVGFGNDPIPGTEQKPF